MACIPCFLGMTSVSERISLSRSNLMYGVDSTRPSYEPSGLRGRACRTLYPSTHILRKEKFRNHLFYEYYVESTASRPQKVLQEITYWEPVLPTKQENRSDKFI